VGGFYAGRGCRSKIAAADSAIASSSTSGAARSHGPESTHKEDRPVSTTSALESVSSASAHFSSWGGQPWPQPPFQAARPAGKLVGGQDCPPHTPTPRKINKSLLKSPSPSRCESSRYSSKARSSVRPLQSCRPCAFDAFYLRRYPPSKPR